MNTQSPAATVGARTPAPVVEVLRCPRCGKTVVTAAQGLECPTGHRMPTTGGYIDAGLGDGDEDTERTFRSFGYEWNTFSEPQPEEEVFWAQYFRDVPLDELTGRMGLDAGCGKGRFTRFTAAHLGWLVALDGSQAVEAATRNLAHLDNVVVVKADLRDAPFEPESFHFVSCLGVLHHLSDPEAGLGALTRLLTPGGLLLLYLYSRPDRGGIRSVALKLSSALRRVTVGVPHPALRILSGPIALVLYACVVVPGAVGARLDVRGLAGLPLATYRHRPLRTLWLDTFDRLSAPLEHRYVWADLEPWFARAGLAVEAVREDGGFFIVARKPPS